MTLYLVRWKTDTTQWGSHTDWVIRAGTAVEAMDIAYADRNTYNVGVHTYNVGVTNRNELTVEIIQPDGPDKIILWYGPDA